MPSHEEGEFELVLGNKQLLSVFFLVILLLAVFFSMGYIVGRNTAPATSLSANNRTPPIVVEPAGSVAPPPADPTKPSASYTPPAAVKQPVVEPPPVKPEPAKPEPAKPQPVKPEPVKVAPAKPEPVKPVKVEPVKPAPAPSAGGSYLQVVATKRPEAEKMVSSLGQQGFRATISPVPDSALVRVLVGPLADTAAINKTRDGLQAIGFKPIVRRF